VASFAFPPKIGSICFLAMKHPMDVSSLAGRVMSSLRLSTRIHPITGWPWLLPSSHPIPPTVPPAGGISLPQGRRHGVTTFRVSDSKYLRPTLSAGGSVARVGRSQIHPNHPLTILVQASQLLWLVYFHDSYKCSLTLTIVSYPNPSPGWSFQERFHLTASAPFAQANFGVPPRRDQEGFIPVKDAP
jgi:hypothetical protein